MHWHLQFYKGYILPYPQIVLFLAVVHPSDPLTTERGGERGGGERCIGRGPHRDHEEMSGCLTSDLLSQHLAHYLWGMSFLPYSFLHSFSPPHPHKQLSPFTASSNPARPHQINSQSLARLAQGFLWHPTSTRPEISTLFRVMAWTKKTSRPMPLAPPTSQSVKRQVSQSASTSASQLGRRLGGWALDVAKFVTSTYCQVSSLAITHISSSKIQQRTHPQNHCI